MAGSGRKVWVADEILAADDLQNYIQDQVVFVYANSTARASGILAPTEGMVSYLNDTNLLYVHDGSSWVEVAPDVGTAGTYTKVTTDAKGRVTSGTTLSVSDIPAISEIRNNTANMRLLINDSGYVDWSQITPYVNKIAFDSSGNIASIAEVKGATIKATSTSSSSIYSDGGITVGGQIYGASMLTPTISGGADWNISDAGGGRFNDGLQSTGVYNTTVTGTYRAVWVSSTGVIGNTASTITKKQNVVDADLNGDAVAQLRPVNFKYKTDVAEFGDEAVQQIGLIAEELLEIPGMEQFVFFDDVDGEKVPAGIHYELLAVALIPAIQKQSVEIELLKARLDKLEK